MTSAIIPEIDTIQLRGVRVHNLKDFDLDLPIGKFIVFTGVSGSGKSSLAFDTLFAEGQRRYIESFPAYARQFLPRFDRPDVDRIDNIPPAIAVGQSGFSKSTTTQVVSATGLIDYLRLLFTQQSTPWCTRCEQPISKETPQSLAGMLQTLPSDTTVQIAFPVAVDENTDLEKLAQSLREEGFVRVESDGVLARIAKEPIPKPQAAPFVRVVLDRFEMSRVEPGRLTESLESAFRMAQGTVHLHWGGDWHEFSDLLRCVVCNTEYPEPHVSLFNLANEEAMCTHCEGTGRQPSFDFDKAVPDKSRTMQRDALLPFAAASYKAELQQFLKQASEHGVPRDLPIERMSDEQRQVLWQGEPDTTFTGLLGFLRSLEEHEQKATVRQFLNRFRRQDRCPQCHGKRLNPLVLAHRIANKDFGDVLLMSAREAAEFFSKKEIENNAASSATYRSVLDQTLRRLRFLVKVGLGYVTLDRQVGTLSVGEAQRVELTNALGCGLAKTLFILDEPTAGLHPCDTQKLIAALRDLHANHNTVVVVEHDLQVLRQADHVVELGPEAGDAGGELIHEGTVVELADNEQSQTAPFLKAMPTPRCRGRSAKGFLQLEGARQNNLQNITVRFPLHCLCVVAGVSGAGKSSLVIDTLYPAVANRLGDFTVDCGEHTQLWGADRLDEVVLIDSDSIGRTQRSNPATYLKVFDEIRRCFAETLDAKTAGISASDFSFNVAGGRCDRCQGIGYLTVDMQFLPDAHIRCPDCQATRYSQRVLQVKYRGLNIAEVLDLTVRHSISFFRGETKIQEKLTLMREVGLGYLRLGQPLTQLSGGEAQRLKLASKMSATKRRGLFLFEEPTMGLHAADVQKLITSFQSLIDVGHSVIVVEHNPQILQAADHLIELGPGAGVDGGRLIAEGTMEEIRKMDTPTGRLLFGE